MNICFEEVYPLWALSTRDVGGLGWDTVEIGKVRNMLIERPTVWALVSVLKLLTMVEPYSSPKKTDFDKRMHA